MDAASFKVQLDDLRARTLEAIAAATSLERLAEVEAGVLGRKGELRALLAGIGALPPEERPRIGALGNPVREALEAAIAERRVELEAAALDARLREEGVDVTLPGRPLWRGSLHPLRETEREIARIFGQFGFVVVESPEVETDELNFQALNIPADHPARDLWDTIYVREPADGDEGGDGPQRLLRTHTSPGQIRAMRAASPPIRILTPGRCYRYEAVDASHGFEFFQVEGLMVDEGTSMAHLRGLLDAFAHAMFGAHRATRFRPGYYPFTEPSVAFDIGCVVCEGAGCPACKRTGWMTILGAGMVHPLVLRNGGIDPERHQGFAFGMGTDRIAMLRYAITDIRAFLADDMRFLERIPGMRVPVSWLREFVDVDLTPEQLADRLTLLGMEVSAIERIGSDWQRVVVGELLEVGPHPRSGKLSLARVRVGAGEPELSIACGATNIEAGQRVPVALPGSRLPGDRAIEVTTIAGVESQGMLCSGDELGLTADADGILVLPPDSPVGTDLAELAGDVVLDVDVKPNRGDALSIVGLAREVAAATGSPLRWPDLSVDEEGDRTADHLRVEVLEPGLCTRFVGRYVEGVTVGPSPWHVQRRLIAAGLRPVSNVVDASNYVLLELGKPVHTFDADAVAGGDLLVRLARAGERLETLDHVVRELTAETLIIADPSGPLAIAGVMGGASSEVSESTRDVIIESAIFDPVSVRRTAFRYGLRSEASLRFEKGQAHGLAPAGADRTAALVLRWAGGRAAVGVVDTNPAEPAARRITFRPWRVDRLLGEEIPVAEQRDLLARVEVRTESAQPGDAVTVIAGEAPLRVEGPELERAVVAIVPSHRRDLVIEADIAEEIARVRGYDTLAARLPDTAMPGYRPDPRRHVDALRDLLAGSGLAEIVTHGLISPTDHARLGYGEDDPATIRAENPVTIEHSQLRRSLIPGHLRFVVDNERQRRPDLAAFEIGAIHAWHDGEATERDLLGIVLAGDESPLTFDRPRHAADMRTAKGLIERVVSRLVGRRLAYTPTEPREGVEHPGRIAAVWAVDRDERRTELGRVGEIHPRLLEAYEVRGAHVVFARIDLATLLGLLQERPRVGPLEHLPGIERDLALVVDEDQAAGEVEALIRTVAGEQLRDVRLFDIYRGSPLAPGHKSLAYRLRFEGIDGPSEEEGVASVMERVVAVASSRLGARLRG